MDAAASQEWTRLKHGKRGALFVDAMIAATAKLHIPIVATRDARDFSEFGLEPNRLVPTCDKRCMTKVRIME